VPPSPPYPPEPWRLQGGMSVSLWRVPPADLPGELAETLPAGARPLLLGGKALVGAAFVRYEPGGVLTYDELLAAVLVRHRGRLRITIPAIWVDSPASLAGGRELWAIPKALAAFQRSPITRGGVAVRAARDGQVLAELRGVPGVRLPGWYRLALRTAQHLDGAEAITLVRARARVRLARTAWRFPAGSPLASLAGRAPIVNATLREMTVSFGSADGATRR
jgi:hypothetical protein